MGQVLSYLGNWDPAPVPIAGLTLSATAYLFAARRVTAHHPDRPWPIARSVAFVTGCVGLALVLVGPVGAWDDVFFWCHMVQHLAIMMVLAPLLLLGAPVLLVLRSVPPRFRRRWVVPLLRSRLMARLSDPVLGWVVFAGTLVGTHFTPFYTYSLTHPLVHDYIEHPLYLCASLMYFSPLIGADPAARRVPALGKVVSLVLAMAPESMTGFAIYTARSVLYPPYAVVARPFGPGPLADQQLGGALMWCAGMLLGAFWTAVAVQSWLRADADAAVRADRRLAGRQAPAVLP